MRDTWIAMFIVLGFGVVPFQKAFPQEKMTVSVETIVDKIRGGLLGQMLGNLNGLHHEFKYNDLPGNVLNYTPALPNGARTDDDTDFEWLYIYEMQKKREVFLDPEYIANIWIEHVNDGVWFSNRFARYLMDIGFKPPYTGYTEFNPWAEFNISGQFLCETFGLIAPAMPQTAAKIGLNYTTVAINSEPAQTTQLFTTMIATAFVESDMDKIIDAGVAALDNKSIIKQIITDIRQWYKENPADWRKTRILLKEKYMKEGGRLRDRNGYEFNTGAIIAALLYGNGDFAESIKLSFNLGWDADCNAATVGTILGTIKGYRWMMTQNKPNEPLWQVVDRYRNTSRNNMPMNETITSFADRLIELFEMINTENGGSKKLKSNIMVYEIPTESPSPVTFLVQSDRKSELRRSFDKQIKIDFNSDNREVRAKATYMAICLDMDELFQKENPQKWEAACYELSGYWKIMSNIFEVIHGNSKNILEFSKKFQKAGFKTPLKRSEDRDNNIYTDKEFWKDPKTLYK